MGYVGFGCALLVVVGLYDLRRDLLVVVSTVVWCRFRLVVVYS